jgi:hypothetical protein
MSARPLALGHSELMAQHKDLGVLLPPLPPRQAQQRHGTGDDQEDQLHAHKSKIIPRPGRRGAERPAARGQRSIQPGDAGFRHPQLKLDDPVQRSQAVRASIEAATTLLPDGGGHRFAGGSIQHALTNQICAYNDDPAR